MQTREVGQAKLIFDTSDDTIWRRDNQLGKPDYVQNLVSTLERNAEYRPEDYQFSSATPHQHILTLPAQENFMGEILNAQAMIDHLRELQARRKLPIRFNYVFEQKDGSQETFEIEWESIVRYQLWQRSALEVSNEFVVGKLALELLADSCRGYKPHDVTTQQNPSPIPSA
jgi:hypothetical protein